MPNHISLYNFYQCSAFLWKSLRLLKVWAFKLLTTLSFLKIVLERGREKHRLAVPLFMHSLVDSFMCTD